MKINCPHCGAHLKPKPEWAGRTAKCRSCNGRIVIPPIHPSVPQASIPEHESQSQHLIVVNNPVSVPNSESDAVKSHRSSDAPQQNAASTTPRSCPYCGEDVLAMAVKCSHCGEWLDETAMSLNSESNKTRLRIDSNARQQIATNSTPRSCPHCTEEIRAIAKKCRHCGEWLDKTTESPTKVLICNALRQARFRVVELPDGTIKAVSPIFFIKDFETLIFFTSVFWAGRVSVRIKPMSARKSVVSVGLTPITHFILVCNIFLGGCFTFGIVWLLFPFYPWVKGNRLNAPQRYLRALVDNARPSS